jgi:hypothetical protein
MLAGREFLEAIRLWKGIHSAETRLDGSIDDVWGNHVKAWFLGLRISRLSELFDLSALSPSVHETVRMFELIFAKEQATFQIGGRRAETGGRDSLRLIKAFLDSHEETLKDGGGLLWSIYEPGKSPPWSDHLQTDAESG